MQRTVIPTRTEAFLRKRFLGVLAILVITLVLTALTFMVFAILLAYTPFPEKYNQMVAIAAMIGAPAIASVVTVFFHKKDLIKRSLVRSEKEASSEQVKNVLIALLIYFAIVLFV